MRSAFILSESPFYFDRKAEGIENGYQAVQSTRRLGILDLVDDPRADPGCQRNLILTQPHPLSLDPYGFRCCVGKGSCKSFL